MTFLYGDSVNFDISWEEFRSLSLIVWDVRPFGSVIQRYTGPQNVHISSHEMCEFTSPLAVHLLQLRDLARQHPEQPAHQVLDADILVVVAAQTGQSPTTMTTHAFWKAVAQMGGYLARRGDGPPGWKTLWKGWLHVQTLLDGVHLAFHLCL